jgi:hypothetical protein
MTEPAAGSCAGSFAAFGTHVTAFDATRFLGRNHSCAVRDRHHPHFRIQAGKSTSTMCASVATTIARLIGCWVRGNHRKKPMTAMTERRTMHNGCPRGHAGG